MRTRFCTPEEQAEVDLLISMDKVQWDKHHRDAAEEIRQQQIAAIALAGEIG
jgi:hypothetical protein